MSVTFDVESDPTTRAVAPACPECGAQSGVRHGKMGCTFQPEGDAYPCDGYGPSLPETGMNVSNVNAGVILFDLLGYGREEQDVYGGTLDPQDVLRRLAVAETRLPECVRAPSETQGVYIDANGVGPGARMIECGLPAERVAAYVHNLTNLAREATIKGRRITYG